MVLGEEDVSGAEAARIDLDSRQVHLSDISPVEGDQGTTS